MRPQLIQRVVEQRQDIEKQSLRRVARVQGQLGLLDDRIAALVPQPVSLQSSLTEHLVSELAEQRRVHNLSMLQQQRQRYEQELGHAQEQLRSARMDRCAADQIQEKQHQALLQQGRRRAQRRLDDFASGRHLALVDHDSFK